MSTGTRLLERLRRPEYTGENRCVPCTATNVAIAVLLAGAVAVLLPTPIGPALGAAVFVAAAAAIYLRGYLVPGTPWFTRTYFPDWLLRAFDKGPAVGAPDAASGGALDVESVLLEAGAVAECDDRDDLCVEPDFRSAWHVEVEAVREADREPHAMVAVLGDDVRLESHGGPPAARHGESLVARWPSEAALVADAAGASVLAERSPAWSRLEPGGRAAVLEGLRLFLDRCPACGGSSTLGEDVVQSCCRWTEVLAVTCDDCGARLLETEIPQED